MQNQKLLLALKFQKVTSENFINPIITYAMCARSKITKHSFNKIHKIQGKRVGDYVSCDIAIFVIYPSRQGFKYVLKITDRATKYTWVYPMKEKSEAFMCIKIFVDVKLREHGYSIKHCHADGGKKLISKSVITLLRNLGATFSWLPADTPELNGLFERKFKTLGKRCLSMMLQPGLPTDFDGMLMRLVTTLQIDCPRRLCKDILLHLKY